MAQAAILVLALYSVVLVKIIGCAISIRYAGLVPDILNNICEDPRNVFFFI